MKQPYKSRVNFDMSKWELGEWPDDLEDVISIRDEFFSKVASKIAKEAIEALFGDGVLLMMSEDGIAILDGSNVEVAVVPWGSIGFAFEDESHPALTKWIEEEKRMLADSRKVG